VSRFRGEYTYSIDAKGRVNIPAKFRKALSPDADETFVVCRAPDKSLRAYPKDAWDRYEDELASRPQTPETIIHSRLLRSTLSESKLDKQGRIKLDAKQIEMAGIDKNVILIGHLGYVEIWGSEHYAAYIGTAADDFDKVFYQSVEAGLKIK